MIAQAKTYLTRPKPQTARGYMEGNHPRRTHGLFSLTPLAVLYEVPAAQEWLDVELQYQRDMLYPSAFAPNGEHADAWDHWPTSLNDPTPFAVALQRMGGEDLFNDPRLVARFRGLPHFFLYGLEQRFGFQWHSSAWFALASRLHDPLAQWIATRPETFQEADEVMTYLFYDPTVPAQPPHDPPGSVYFPYSGLVKLCSGWDSNAVQIPFRCGPEIPKDRGDENGFRLRVGGEWLLPRVTDANRKPEEPAELTWDLLGWYRGSPAQNIVLPDPDQIGDYEKYQQTGCIPIKGGFQFGENPPMKGREYGRQWLSGGEFPPNGNLRVVAFSPAVDYVCGEAHRAFALSRPSLWVRHLLFSKGEPGGLPPYVLICDELEAGDQPQTFAWQLHPRNPFTVHGRELSVRHRNASLDVHFLAPPEAKLIEKTAPAPMEAERTRFVQYRLPSPQARGYFLTALCPRSQGTNGPTPTFNVIKADGGWAVEVCLGNVTDLALFRSERSKQVEAMNWQTTSTAALVQQSPGKATTIYLLGQP